jgi:hypothetical protein
MDILVENNTYYFLVWMKIEVSECRKPPGFI